ncbi:hypothetical protein AGMMS49950_09790 [Endomicrobiia bacterium]|nr:hypothetical protein AGMMS49950_09790 [Endomicrobiia bacterium]
MKQKKKACGSGGMGLVLIGVKEAFDKTVRIARSKKKKEEGWQSISDQSNTLKKYINDLLR